MTRDEFEDWLEDHVDGAVEDGPQSDTELQSWVARLAAQLKIAATVSAEEEEDDDSFDADDDDDLETEDDDEEEEA